MFSCGVYEWISDCSNISICFYHKNMQMVQNKILSQNTYFTKTTVAFKSLLISITYCSTEINLCTNLHWCVKQTVFIDPEYRAYPTEKVTEEFFSICIFILVKHKPDKYIKHRGKKKVTFGDISMYVTNNQITQLVRIL